MTAELWPHIKDQDWSLVNSVKRHAAPGQSQSSRWTSTIAGSVGSGAAGQGYGPPASIGAALGNKSLGRFSVSIQGDGDFMYAPGSFWTAAHHNIPLLTMIAQQPRLPPGGHARAAALQPAQPRRQPRQDDGAGRHLASKIRTSIMPSMAKSMGWWSTGPIKDPTELGTALSEGGRRS